MGETAEERKKRLQELREGAEKQDKELKFRNYLPRDEELQAGQVWSAFRSSFLIPNHTPRRTNT
tara:strand:- start:8020 stop:8211 length:192 start_codon:yes stop_codon:yes gene_type:complete